MFEMLYSGSGPRCVWEVEDSRVEEPKEDDNNQDHEAYGQW